MSPDQKMTEVDEKHASHKLTVVYSLDGIFKSETRAFYFKSTHITAGGGTLMSSNTDGPDGTGYGASVSANPLSKVVEVKIDVYWTIKTSRGKSEITLTVPYFEPARGNAAGFGYEATWAKLD